MRASVIINTYNRATILRAVLESLRFQTYPDFEVIVVNGPSTDGTDALLREWADRVRVENCPEANLSMSRNIGIAAASGEIVCFLDDDALPEPRWLTELLAGYDSDQVGGVGGLVYDHTGFEAQYTLNVCDRRANASWGTAPPQWGYVLPGADPFLYLTGCNCSFRRCGLVEIGGFDEEIEYYLDEVLVCMRLIDRGYRLRALDRAAVYHKNMPSELRKAPRVIRRPFPIIKNKFYFALQNRRADEPISAILDDCQGFADMFVQSAENNRRAGLLDLGELDTFVDEVERGTWVGIARGLHSRPRLRRLPPPNSDHFRRFSTIQPHGQRHVFCLVSQDLSTNWELAHAAAAVGHEVHLLTRSTNHNRVDLEEGVWVHRLVDEPEPTQSLDPNPEVRRQLRRAAAVHREVRRLAERRNVDLVSVPLHDCEGVYCLLDDSLRCILIAPEAADPERLTTLERAALRAAQYIHRPATEGPRRRVVEAALAAFLDILRRESGEAS